MIQNLIYNQKQQMILQIRQKINQQNHIYHLDINKLSKVTHNLMQTLLILALRLIVLTRST